MRRLTVIIANYNYARFIGDAIDSAIAQHWSDCEIIVVDDGSTDESVSVVRRYGERVRLIEQENAGQREAMNRGFALATGDAVVFLDADDALEPGFASKTMAALGDGVSKVQVPMRRMTVDGTPTDSVFPALSPAPDPSQVLRWMLATTAYPTPPGSGNLYARAFLEQIFPIGPELGSAGDSACLAAAPFFGDVVTVPEPLVRYRLHGENDSNLLKDPVRFVIEVERAVLRHRYTLELRGVPATKRSLSPLFRSRHLLQLRVAASRLRPEDRPLPGDSRARMLWDAVRDVVAPGPERLIHRLTVAGWCLATLLAPSGRAVRLIERRFRAKA